jgi:SSS family solute:Na+ symporter
MGDLTPLWVILGYLAMLVGLGIFSASLFRGTSSDYFVASRSIGSFLLLMSVFGTTMTAFALVGSTGKAYDLGIGVYGLMASSSGLVHSLVFFLVGIRLWAIGKRYGYLTQIEFFRNRFDSNAIGYLLFPILVGLVIPYLLIGLIGAGAVVRGVTVGMFPELFPGTPNPATGALMFVGGVPQWVTSLVICSVVLFYIFFGGLRGAAWANAFQTIVFMITGVLAFVLIANQLGGLRTASELVEMNSPEHLAREGMIGPVQFMSYMLVPLSVGMFPHLFQHWLTARSAKTFRLTVIAHPLFIMIVWVPCILIGIWAVGAGITAPGGNANAVLAKMVGDLLGNPLLTGLLMLITFVLSLLRPPHIFDLAVWCFSGFASLFPLVFAAIYWRRVTKAGAIASILVTAVVWFVLFYQDIINPSAERLAEEGDMLIFGMMPVAVIFAASAATLVLVSLVTTPPAPESVERFFPDRSSPQTR